MYNQYEILYKTVVKSKKMATYAAKIILIFGLFGFAMMAKAENDNKTTSSVKTFLPSEIDSRILAPEYRLQETPRLAVSGNMLHNLSTSMNLSAEMKLGQNITLDISSTLNPWTYNKEDNVKAKFLLIQPELRYWTCEAFDGHFFGLHAH